MGEVHATTQCPKISAIFCEISSVGWTIVNNSNFSLRSPCRPSPGLSDVTVCTPGHFNLQRRLFSAGLDMDSC
jgi:hypothetical protein